MEDKLDISHSLPRQAKACSSRPEIHLPQRAGQGRIVKKPRDAAGKAIPSARVYLGDAGSYG